MLMDIYFWVGTAMVGSAFGSFATLLIYRLPRGEDVIVRRSECTACHHRLGLLERFPIFSWFWLRGRCRYCGTVYGMRYVLIEIVCTGLFLLSAALWGFTWIGLIMALSVFIFLVMLVIDLEWKIIPDSLQIALFVLGVIYSFLQDRALTELLLFSVFMGVGSYGLRALFLWLRKKEALGLGDVKFFMVAGCFLTLELLPAFLLLSGLFGTVFGFLWQYWMREARFPFAPALVVALYLCISFPELFHLFPYAYLG